METALKGTDRYRYGFLGQWGSGMKAHLPDHQFEGEHGSFVKSTWRQAMEICH